MIKDPRDISMGNKDFSGPDRVDPDSLPKALRLSQPLCKNRPKEEVYQGIPIEEIGILKENSRIRPGNVTLEEGLENPESYMETNFSTLKDNMNKISGIFQGQVVVDLGAGKNSMGYYLANLAKAKSYVGVDTFNSARLRRALSKYEKDVKNEDGIPYSVVDSDILSFLENVKNDSISMLASGIDDYIIENGTYISQISKEIQRTMHPQGGLLSVMSSLYIPNKNKITIIDNNPNGYLGNRVAILKK